MNVEWIDERVRYINSLKSPTDQQKLLALLWEQKERTKEDERKIATLVRAERAVDRAQRARAEAAKLVSQEAEARRKARTRKLIELGGIVDLAGGLDMDKGTLLGLINHGISVADDEKRQKWKSYGDGVLASREKKKKPRKSAEAVS